LVYFIVYILGKNQKIGVWKIGHVDGLRVKVRPGWKRQIAKQVGALSEPCALVFGGKALVDLGKGGGGAVNNFAFKDDRRRMIEDGQ